MRYLKLSLPVFFSLLFPGLGQIYVGKIKAGIGLATPVFFFFLAEYGNYYVADLTMWGLMHLTFLGAFISWVYGLINSIKYSYSLFKGTVPKNPLWPARMYLTILLLSPFLYVEGYFLWNIIVTPIGTDVLYGDSLSKRREAEENYLKELQDTYGKEFVIKKTYYNQNLNGRRWYAFDTYAKDDPELIFQDDYYGMVLSKCSKEELKPIIEQYFGNNINFFTSVYYESSCQEADLQFTGKTAFDHLVNKYPNKIPLTLRLNIIKDLTGENKKQELTNILSIIKFVQSKKLGALNLEINYYDPIILKEELIDKKALNDPNFHNNYVRYRRYLLLMNISDFNKINSESDIEPNLRISKFNDGIK